MRILEACWDGGYVGSFGDSRWAGSARAEREERSSCDGGEPDIKAALGWWTELPNKWTVVGWKNHLFRFNVLFNGTLLAQPDTNRRTEKWKGQGLQSSFLPLGNGAFGTKPRAEILSTSIGREILPYVSQAGWR